MNRHFKGSFLVPLALTVFLSLLVVDANATQVLFDNGDVSGSQRNLRNTASQNQRLYEDFTIGIGSIITGINWQQFDHNQATYLSTEVTIYDGLPQVGSLVYGATLVASRAPNAAGTIFSNWDGYDYWVDGLSIFLGPGTYWIGINQNHTGISPGWANTVGGPDMISGSRLININFPPPGSVETDNLAFILEGHPAPEPIPLDIKPTSCPNPLDLKSRGVLPVAILGTEDFDVTTIDPSTIELTLEGIQEGVSPIHWSYEDVATPYEGEPCDCHDLDGDGYLDLTLKFDTQEVIETLMLTEALEETVLLTITGNLEEEYDGAPIMGQDCVRVLGPNR